MTAFDRIEPRLSELLDDLGAPSTPDYFDDMLRATARTRQRPAWSALERWLPMGVIARPLPIRPVPWRLFAIAAAILLLATAALVYVGSTKRVPPPFGPARNGAFAIGTADGDIVTIDLQTGKTSLLIAGTTHDAYPYFLNDGQRMLFDRKTTATDDVAALYIADADGSDGRQLFAADPSTAWVNLSPDGGRALGIDSTTGKGRLVIADIAAGTRTAVDLGLDVMSASWRPQHEQVVVTAKVGGNVTYWVVNADGTGRSQIDAAASAINEPTLSPDGTTLAYTTWEPARVHVTNIDTGGDHPITTGDDVGDVWQSPQFSPDGTHILVNRFVTNSDPVVGRLAVIGADGVVAPMNVGPMTENPLPEALFSPDATQILASYSTLKKTFLFDVDDGEAHELPYIAMVGESWQRQAP